MPLIRLASVLFGAAFLVAAQNVKTKTEGAECLAASGGNPAWFCTALPKCPVALKLAKVKRLPPVHRRCAFTGADQVVCCPPYEISDWNSTVPGPVPTSAVTPAPRPTPPKTKKPPLVIEGSSKAAVMCREYAQLIYVRNAIVPLSGGSSPPEDLEKRCEVAETLIVGGENAHPRQFPHMALLGFGNPPNYQCGGSLISDRFVLTAAHCQHHSQFGPLETVLLGDLDIQSDTDDAAPTTFKVTRMIKHPEYKPPSLYNDIMLLELEKPVNFSSYIRPLCLLQALEYPLPKHGIVTGWGRNGSEPVLLTDSMSPSNSKLQMIQLPFLGAEECADTYSGYFGSDQLKFGIMNDTQFCAGAEPNKDSCPGDSGGPLQLKIDNCIYSQVGIVSFGRECGTRGSPGVYTRVDAFIPWIEKIVWP